MDFRPIASESGELDPAGKASHSFLGLGLMVVEVKCVDIELPGYYGERSYKMHSYTAALVLQKPTSMDTCT